MGCEKGSLIVAEVRRVGAVGYGKRFRFGIFAYGGVDGKRHFGDGVSGGNRGKAMTDGEKPDSRGRRMACRFGSLELKLTQGSGDEVHREESP